MSPVLTDIQSSSKEPAQKSSNANTQQSTEMADSQPQFNPDMFPCPKPACVRIFTSAVGLNYHLRISHPDNIKLKFKCTTEGCTKRYVSAKSLREHTENGKHEVADHQSITCQLKEGLASDHEHAERAICGRIMRTAKGLRQHEVKFHEFWRCGFLKPEVRLCYEQFS